MDSNNSSQDRHEDQTRVETHQQDSVVECFRRDIRSLFRSIGLQGVLRLGSTHLSRDQFDAQCCSTEAAAEEHLLALYMAANRRRGKIRNVICRCIARQMSGRSTMLR